MKEYKVPVQSLINHIKTAIDLDPWAQEMAEELLKRHEPVEPEVEIVSENLCVYKCPACHGSYLRRKQKYCGACGQAVKWNEHRKSNK